MGAGVQDTEEEIMFLIPCHSASTAFSVFVFTLHDSRYSQKGYHYTGFYFEAGIED